VVAYAKDHPKKALVAAAATGAVAGALWMAFRRKKVTVFLFGFPSNRAVLSG